MSGTKGVYTLRLKVKFSDLRQIEDFCMSDTMIAERMQLELEDGSAQKLFQEHGCCEADVSFPAEIYFEAESDGQQEVQAILNGIHQVGAELTLTMGWVQ